MAIKLIADSGSTKTEWCLINGKSAKTFYTQGLSPYFLSAEQIEYIIKEELQVKFKKTEPDEIYFYGTGCSNAENVKLVKKAIQQVFTIAKVSVDHDLMGAAKALCGHEKGIACILGTGSNSGY
jgi:N-acetylglucosamine kinase-like BadF-type ATPase